MLGSCFGCQTKNDYYRLQGLQPYHTRQAHQIPCDGIVLFQEVPDNKQPRVARSKTDSVRTAVPYSFGTSTQPAIC